MLNSHNKGVDNRKMIWSLYMLEKSINNNFNSYYLSINLMRIDHESYKEFGEQF